MKINNLKKHQEKPKYYKQEKLSTINHFNSNNTNEHCFHVFFLFFRFILNFSVVSGHCS